MPMPTIFRVFQYTGCILTEISCSLLLFLIFTRASSKFGSYKYLMASFTIFSMIYAIVEILAQPIMHVHGSGLIVYVDSFLRYDKYLGFHAAGLYCSSFGICVSLLSTHFFYRYLAVSKPHLIRHLQGKRLTVLFLPSIFFGIIWFLATEIGEAPSDINSKYMQESVEFYYHDDVFKVAQLSAVYYYHDSAGDLHIQWHHIIGVVIMYIIMTISLSSILYFGLKTYQTVYSHTKMSKKTRDLHRQLFLTLVLQSIIPFVTLFIPVGLLFFIPFLNLSTGVGIWANAPGAYISFYPAVDALIAIFMIKDFRNAVMCKPRNKVRIMASTVDASDICRQQNSSLA